MKFSLGILALLVVGACASGPKPAAEPLTTARGTAEQCSSDFAPEEEGGRRRGLYRQAAEAVLGDIDGAKPLTHRLVAICSPAEVEEAIWAYCEKHPPAAVCMRSQRNARVGLLIHASDERCTDYLNSLNETARESNLIFGSLTAVLTGMGAAFAPAGAVTVSALSASATGTNALRGEFGTAFFASQSTPTIRKAITSGRDDLRKAMLTSMDQDYAAFPYSVAAAEAERYHAACSLGYAFAHIEGALENQNRPRTAEEMKKIIEEYTKLRAQLLAAAR